MLTNRTPSIQLILLAFLGLLAVGLSLATGHIHLQIHDMFDNSNALHHQVFTTLRLPRTLSAFTCGALLALAGALLQVLLRNPLADPYILGISSGAVLMTLTGFLLGMSTATFPLLAMLGCVLPMVLLFFVNFRAAHFSSYRLLLTGIMLASFEGALARFILTNSQDNTLRSTLFWLMGEITPNHFPIIALIILAFCLACCISIAKPLNVLTLGEHKALTLGVDTKRLRATIYILSATLTGTAVSIAGPIGFIGLITPHALRLLGIRKHETLLPACVLAGGAFLTFADTLARIIIRPTEIPVGIVTALIGAPIFTLLLWRGETR